MIDTIYRVLQTIVNKEQNGYVSPDEINLIAHTVQMEIYREYFDDENKDKNRQNRGLTNAGYSNLSANTRQRIQQFAAIQTLTFDATNQRFLLPEDLYLLEENGLTTLQGRVLDELERSSVGYALRSTANPSEVFPCYERYNKSIKVHPVTITSNINCRYLRKPIPPKWTFIMVNGNPFFNPAATDYSDFELHESEFTNIVMRMLTLFGINLREQEIVQVAEALKDKTNIKESN